MKMGSYLSSVAIPSNLPRPSFEQLFRKELGLKEAEYNLVLSRFVVRHFQKRTFLLNAGDVSTGKFYVNSGCTRSFVLDRKGKEHVLFFGFEDWWLADFESYMTGKPGKQFIQAIEDLELLYISKPDFHALTVQVPALHEWFEVRQKKMTFAMVDRLIEVKTMCPEERIEKLARARPAIFQRVALHDIASYLDIEPGSLSRIRKRMLGEHRIS